MSLGQFERVGYPPLSDFLYRRGMAFPVWAGLMTLLFLMMTCNLSPTNLFSLWTGPLAATHPKLFRWPTRPLK